MNFYLYENQTLIKKMKKNLRKNLHNSKNSRIFATCLRENTASYKFIVEFLNVLNYGKQNYLHCGNSK